MIMKRLVRRRAGTSHPPRRAHFPRILRAFIAGHVIVCINPRKARDAKCESAGRPRRLAIEAAIPLWPAQGTAIPACPGRIGNASTGCRPRWRRSAEDPAYAEETGPQGVPDPPHRPFPPRCFPARCISGRSALTLPAGSTSESAVRSRGSRPARDAGDLSAMARARRRRGTGGPGGAGAARERRRPGSAAGPGAPASRGSPRGKNRARLLSGRVPAPSRIPHARSHARDQPASPPELCEFRLSNAEPSSYAWRSTARPARAWQRAVPSP
jgi:hypothetical protein